MLKNLLGPSYGVALVSKSKSWAYPVFCFPSTCSRKKPPLPVLGIDDCREGGARGPEGVQGHTACTGKRNSRLVQAGARRALIAAVEGKEIPAVIGSLKDGRGSGRQGDNTFLAGSWYLLAHGAQPPSLSHAPFAEV